MATEGKPQRIDKLDNKDNTSKSQVPGGKEAVGVEDYGSSGGYQAKRELGHRTGVALVGGGVGWVWGWVWWGWVWVCG